MDLHESLDPSPDLVAGGSVWADRRGDRNDAVPREQLADPADAPDVCVSILLGERQAGRQVRPDLIPVEDLDPLPAPCDARGERLRDRRLPGAR